MFEFEAARPAESVGGSPLASFDPAGNATRISYQLSEPTSYTGKHVLTLQYALADFADVSSYSTGSPASSRVSAAESGTPGVPGGQTGFSPAATDASSPADSVTVPRAVVLTDSAVATDPIIALSPFPQSARLMALTWATVAAVAASNKRLEVFRSIGGELDYRVRDLRTSLTSAAGNPTPGKAVVQRMPRLRPFALPIDDKGGTDPGSGGDFAYVRVVIRSPDDGNPTLPGPWNGFDIPVNGTLSARRAGYITVTALLLDSTGAEKARATASPALGASGWSASLPVTASGNYTVQVTAEGTADGTSGADSAHITVVLAAPPVSPPVTPPSVAPSVLVGAPVRNQVVISATGNAIVPIAGTVTGSDGVALTMIVDGGGDVAVALAPAADGSWTFSTSTLIGSSGRHAVTFRAVNADGTASPAISVPFSLSADQPLRPLDRRLLLIEHIGITSFLGNCGASRIVKTVSLLPGETTTITVNTYTKTEESSKAASSILDSAASECAADFEDTLNEETDTKASTADATTKSISADLGASCVWGHVDIKAGYTGQANASRENAAKNVKNAVAKHTSKASSNRSVSVNTEFTTTTSKGDTTDTSRILKNINVSRVLNFVFRLLTQEYVVLIHLVDATVGYYTLDELLDGNGDPLIGPDGGPMTRETFTEYTLSELLRFASTEMSESGSGLPSDIMNVLGAIPDYAGSQQSLIEMVTPTAVDGTPQPSGRYLRVKPGLTQTFQAPGDGGSFTVPGIILGSNSCVMRTDQLLCDALLGEGDALDGYSHGLQDVALAERQAAVDEQTAATARELLAQQIISSKDADMAAAWQKVFPQPLSVPATVTVPTGELMASTNGHAR